MREALRLTCFAAELAAPLPFVFLNRCPNITFCALVSAYDHL